MTRLDRMAVMDEGRVAQIGTAGRDLRVPRPRRFVADFIGDVNMLEAAWSRPAATSSMPRRQAGCEIVADRGDAVRVGETVWVAIRPENSPSPRSSPRPGGQRVTGGSGDIAYLGDLSIYHVRLASGTVVRCSPGQPQSPASSGRSPGTTRSG